jgi:hypothetical protein
MPERIMDYLKDLPPQFQFILLFIGVLGSSGFFAGFWSVWKMYGGATVAKQAARDAREANESKARLETQLTEQRVRIEALELERLRAQTEAQQAAATSENMQKLIEVIATGNERWQKVFDTKSERQLKADELQHETNKMFIESVKRNTETVANISEMLEIQSEHLGGFGRVMQHFENKLETTLQTVESTTRDNRSDLTTALGMNVNQRNENENTLRSILQSVESLRTDVKYILNQSETQRNQTLAGVDAKFNLIEKRLTEFIMPRPALLGVPEIIDENSSADKAAPVNDAIGM